MALQGHWLLDETSGLTAVDQINSNDGSLINMAGDEWTDGIVLNPPPPLGFGALDFDGVSDYMRFNQTSALNTGIYSVALWAKSETTNSNKFLFGRNNTNPGTFLFWHLSSGEIRVQIRLDGSEGTARQIQSDNVVDSNWHHYAGVYDGSELKLYVDAVLQADTLSVSGTIDTDNPQTYIITSAHPSVSSYWGGLIDDLRIYDHGLNGTEVTELYNLKDNLLACWNYTAKYKNSNRLYRANGGGDFPKELKVPSSVDITTGIMIDEGIKIESEKYKIIQ